MITAVDTNVLVDVFKADPTFGPHSAETLARCLFYRDDFEPLVVIDPMDDDSQ